MFVDEDAYAVIGEFVPTPQSYVALRASCRGVRERLAQRWFIELDGLVALLLTVAAERRHACLSSLRLRHRGSLGLVFERLSGILQYDVITTIAAEALADAKVDDIRSLNADQLKDLSELLLSGSLELDECKKIGIVNHERGNLVNWYPLFRSKSVLQRFLAIFPPVHTYQWQHVLSSVCRGGSVDCLDFVVEQGQVQLTDRRLLVEAVSLGYRDIVNRFLEAGITQDHQGILAAVKSGNHGICKALIEHGAPVDGLVTSDDYKFRAELRNGSSALHVLAFCDECTDEVAIVDLLVGCGLEVNQLNAAGFTALDYASLMGKAGLTGALLKLGALSSAELMRQATVRASTERFRVRPVA